MWCTPLKAKHKHYNLENKLGIRPKRLGKTQEHIRYILQLHFDQTWDWPSRNCTRSSRRSHMCPCHTRTTRKRSCSSSLDISQNRSSHRRSTCPGTFDTMGQRNLVHIVHIAILKNLLRRHMCHWRYRRLLTYKPGNKMWTGLQKRLGPARARVIERCQGLKQIGREMIETRWIERSRQY